MRQSVGAFRLSLRRLCATMSPTKRIKIEDSASCGLQDNLNWIDTTIPHGEMKPSSTLCIGQCFNWYPINSKLWVGVLGNQAIAIRETEYSSQYALLNNTTLDIASSLNDYFQTTESLSALYDQWKGSCSRMSVICTCLPGVRVVRQDPLECLVSFILSSNNNISRITKLLQTIRSRYGRYLCSVLYDKHQIRISHCLQQRDASTTPASTAQIDLFAFPSLDELAGVSIEEYQSLGLGYRAKYLHSTLKTVQAHGLSWLLNLRSQPRSVVQQHLMTLSGVGPKVADCIALFSLDQADVIPVDTHVWDIATRDYDAQLIQKSLTPAVYNAVGDIFRTRFGAKAGWAHSILFAAELPQFSVLLPLSLQQEMREHKDLKKLVLPKKAKKSKVNQEKA